MRKQLHDMDNRLFKKLVYYDWPGNVRELEKDAIQRAVEIYDRNMTKVAKALGISRNALYQKIKKYCLNI
ncbi:MAG: helix-turn-helix domain-containing protein [Bacteroidales bacterium]